MANANDSGSGKPPKPPASQAPTANPARPPPARPPAVPSLAPIPVKPLEAPSIPPAPIRAPAAAQAPGAVRPPGNRPPPPTLVIPSVPAVAPGTARPPAGPPPRAPTSAGIPVVPSLAPKVAAPSLPAVPAVTPPPAAPSGTGAAGTNLRTEELVDLFDRASKLDELDYFEVLKLERTAGLAEIKKAFYRESRTFHPDRFFQLTDTTLKEKVNEVYKRVTEAYFFLRDETKRKKYLGDIAGPERAQKLRFTEASEAETKLEKKKEQEEQIGTHPKGRQFFQTGLADFTAERWSAAERNFKMALTYEPQNARYKEKLTEVQGKVAALTKERGEGFKIK